jgi:hypothetical protein
VLIDQTHKKWMIGSAVLLVLATAAYIPYVMASPQGATGGSVIGLTYGVVGLGLMIFVGLLGLRKKFPVWRVGRAQTWMRGHLWLGLLAFPIIWYHAGFQLGGALTLALMVLFTIVVISGLFGAALQHFLPRMITSQVPMETIYEEIPRIRQQLVEEADTLVASVCGPLGLAGAPQPALSAAGHIWSGRGIAANPVGGVTRTAVDADEETTVQLRSFYVDEMRSYLLAPGGDDLPLALPVRSKGIFQQVRTLLPQPLHETLADMENIAEEKRQLDRQARYHKVLHGWLLVHIPLSYALLLLAIVHAVVALRY